jgi:hypothetical protein
MTEEIHISHRIMHTTYTLDMCHIVAIDNDKAAGEVQTAYYPNTTDNVSLSYDKRRLVELQTFTYHNTVPLPSSLCTSKIVDALGSCCTDTNTV